MGQARVKKLRGMSPEKQRFMYLLRKISRYTEWQIVQFANRRFNEKGERKICRAIQS